MADLSRIPTEELMRMYQGAAPVAAAEGQGPLRITIHPPKPNSAPDLSGVSTEDLLKAYQGEQSAQPAQPEKPLLQNIGETISDAATGVGKGLTLGWGDELFSAGMTPFEMARGAIDGQDEGKGFGERVSDAYGRALGFNRGFDKRAEERSPIASTVGNVVGGALTAGGLAKNGVTLLNAARPTATSLIGRGALEGAGYGAVQGAGEGEGFRDSVKSAAQGGGIGLATGGAIGSIAARLTNSAAAKAIPSIDDLKTLARAAYKAAEDAGVVVKPQSFRNLVASVKYKLSREGVDTTLHPGVMAALGRLEEATGRPLSFETLDILRRVSNGAKSSISADERRLASILSDKIDDFMTALKPNDLLAGNGPAAGRAIRDARSLWSRMRKGEMIQDLIERAETRAQQFSGSGYENALRTEFRSLVMNDKKMRGFTPIERAALKRVAKGGTVENMLRMLGKFAPTGIVSTALSGGTGAAVGGPVGAVALPVMGLAARQAATRMTLGNAARAGMIARAGGTVPTQALTSQQRSLLGAGQGGLTTLQRLVYGQPASTN